MQTCIHSYFQKDQGKAKLQSFKTNHRSAPLDFNLEQDLDQRLAAGLRSQQVCCTEAWSHRALYVINKTF